MADVQPLEAIRFAPGVDLARAICPPFDIISPREQRRLYKLSPHNAVRLELPRDRDPYKAAARTLRRWLDNGTLAREEAPAFYVYQQEFRHGEQAYRRRVLFARLRLEPWEKGTVLPHERTFSAPKEDRLNLLRSLRLNTSPIFLVYADSEARVAPLLARCAGLPPDVRFSDANGLAHTLWRVDEPRVSVAISRAFEKERLYVADGHHRYETALAFSEEQAGPGDAPERLALVALSAVDDPGLLVLPIHRIVNADIPVDELLGRLVDLFEIDSRPSLADVLRGMADRGRMVGSFGLIAADSPDYYLLTLFDAEAADAYLPPERSSTWRRLDAAVVSHVIIRHGMGLDDTQMEDISTVRYGEDAGEAEAEVRRGRARYAVLLNPVSPARVLAVADAGERMPQKSTFFYPKVPTGLLFNPLFAR